MNNPTVEACHNAVKRDPALIQDPLFQRLVDSIHVDEIMRDVHDSKEKRDAVVALATKVMDVVGGIMTREDLMAPLAAILLVEMAMLTSLVESHRVKGD